MDAGDLQGGFRLGDWLVEPRAQRVSGRGGIFVVPPPHLQVLMCLAEHHGEAVDSRTLCSRGWAGEPDGEGKLVDAIQALHSLFGDDPQHPRYIVPVGGDGYALIAHFEPVPGSRFQPIAESRAPRAPPPAKRPLAARLHGLIAELRRRQVFKVTASYLVGMWIVLQVAEVTFAPLHFPSWWITALTILAILGLPIAIVLAWSYEITPSGIAIDTADADVAVKLPKARRAVAPVVVAGVAAMAGVTGFAWWRTIQTQAIDTAPAPEPGAQSIAVLPFVDMSPRGGNAYLGDGLSEELSMRLAQVPGLRVAARTSAFEFKDKSLDVRRIGQSLGVRHVLEGSVRREGDSLRVTVQLIDARTGYHVWAGNYDRGWREVLALQDDIARAVTDALKIVLAANAAATPTTATKFDVRAIDPYLAGLALLRQPGDLSRLLEAEQLFTRAIAIDPAFAGAHAGLCRVRARRFDRTRDPAALVTAEQSCRRALAIDASLVDTEKALAGLYVSGGQFDRAEAAYRALLRRSPQDADAHIGMGQTLEGHGRSEAAEASFREAVAADPAYWRSYAVLATHLMQRGRVDEAVAAFRKVAELAPSSAAAWSDLGGALQMDGKFSEAADAYRRSLLLEPSKSAYSNLATMHFYLGQFAQAVQNFERAVAHGEHDQIVWGNLADALWQIDGRREEAVRKYRRAIELAEAELAATPGDPTLRAQLGYYYGRVGEAGISERYLAQAAVTGADQLYVQYYRAVAAADRGDRAAALQALADLVALGYPKALLRSAPEFRSLLQDRRYKEIVGMS